MSVRLGIGAGLGTDLSAVQYWQWVDLCEVSGIDSIWHSDQLLGTTPEPVTMLAALAARTTRMRFGTNALVLAFRDPLVIAKEFATIDFLSDGRLLPLFGVGATEDPYWQATGMPSGERGQRANEAIDLIRRLLHEDEIVFEGEHYRYEGHGIRPRPASPIPLWIGGNSKAAVQRTADLGDGWLGSLIGPDAAGTARSAIETALADNGRTIDPDHYGMTLFLRIGARDDPAVVATRKKLGERFARSGAEQTDDLFAIGTADEVIATIRRYVDAGMSKFVALPIADSFDDLMAQTRLLVSDVLPAVETGFGGA